MKSISFKNKKALVRVDFNVPFDTDLNITDDTRIQKALPTIKYILGEGGAVVLMSHLGRPLKKLNEDGSINVRKFSLQNVVNHLSTLLSLPIQFASDTIGQDAQSKASALKPGELLLVENTRFHAEETKGDENFAKEMSKLADIYINDAFGAAHRAHASTSIVAKFFAKNAKAFGLLMESEVINGNKVLSEPEKPFTAILGGAKVSDKIQLIDKLLDKCDNILIGGGMSYTFSKAAGGNIGNSICEDDFLNLANELKIKAKSKGVNIILPIDSVIADDFSNEAKLQTVEAGKIPDGWQGLDIGPKSIALFTETIAKSKTLIWNGPVGVFEFENLAHGTNAIAQAVADTTQSNAAFSLIGGGDSVSALNKSGLADKVSFISTGGGAMLEFLEGKTLPGIAAILD